MRLPLCSACAPSPTRGRRLSLAIWPRLFTPPAPRLFSLRSADGDRYYFDANGVTVWDLPTAPAPQASAAEAEAVPLPAGWYEAKDNGGDVYYFNDAQEVRWTRPTAGDA